MTKPELEVIRFNGFSDLATNSSCPSNQNCTSHCDPVQGFCSECMDDCSGID